MPTPLKYNAEYHDDWAWSLALKGATDQEVAEAFGVSKRTQYVERTFTLSGWWEYDRTPKSRRLCTRGQ